MKLFLLSADITESLADSFNQLLGKPKATRALFITTAAVPYGLNPKPEWLTKSLAGMEQFAEKIDETSLEEGDYMPTDLSIYDFIFMTGGNSFYLAYRLAETGIGEKIKQYINDGGLYSGSSAGSIILMNSIENFAPADDPSKAPKTYPGLGLLDFALIPHSDNEKYSDVMGNIARNYKDAGDEVVTLNDNQVIIVNGDSRKVVEG